MPITREMIDYLLGELALEQQAACEERVTNIFIYGEDPSLVSEDERTELEAHFDECERCRKVLEAAQQPFTKEEMEQMTRKAKELYRKAKELHG